MKYADIYLVPNYSTVKSRNDCDTTIQFGGITYVKSRNNCNTTVQFAGFTFGLPIVPSNMLSVIDCHLAKQLAQRNYFYILHRFMEYPKILNFVKHMHQSNLISSISVGVKDRDYDLINLLTNCPPDFITIDIAHGHSVLMQKMIKYIKLKLPTTFVIAGNVATHQAVYDLKQWGANCVKIGIGNGSICTTTPNTGFHGSPAEILVGLNADCPIIADGDIRRPGDIVKALVLGADMVMIGGMLAGFEESPGKLTVINGAYHKLYSGSTADNIKYVEGKKIAVPIKGSIWAEYDRITQAVQSAISYAGGHDLNSFYNVKWERF